MHDWTLKSVFFEWKLARATLVFENSKALDASLVAEGVIDLHVPQRREWGQSVSVNIIVGPSDIGSGMRKLAIEMQSGDVITITAAAFDIPAD